MILREATPADDAAIVETYAACYPSRVLTPESVRADHEAAPPQEHPLTVLAEDGGKVVGLARSHVDLESEFTDLAVTTVMVLPGHRRKGVGTALQRRVAEHQRAIGMRRTVARTADADGAAFASGLGLAESRVERISFIDPSTVEAPGPLPEGITLRSLGEIDDLRPVYDLDCAVSADVPSATPFQPYSYEQWTVSIVGTPLLDRDCSLIGYADGEPVVMVFCDTAGTRMFSGLAGTRADHRGRGLARVVKAHALRRAAGKGVREAYTNNDDTNAAMLAVNTALGYREHSRQTLVLGPI
ncbi:GNAT family N-acetyltransferase [Phytomonospora sp. NPDC050363]|uniref:GNAT family N-acetyltransferase n=1 Tax=Phytomonospora sp. NPDC050363 TaxID=3155642 RepID=UPI0033F47E4D